MITFFFVVHVEKLMKFVYFYIFFRNLYVVDFWVSIWDRKKYHLNTSVLVIRFIYKWELFDILIPRLWQKKNQKKNIFDILILKKKKKTCYSLVLLFFGIPAVHFQPILINELDLDLFKFWLRVKLKIDMFLVMQSATYILGHGGVAHISGLHNCDLFFYF